MTPKSSALGTMAVTIWQFVIVVLETAVIIADSPALLMIISSGMHVFLQTAQVNVSIPWNEQSHSLTVSAIFDKVVNALKLRPVKVERLKIATFRDQKQELEAVNLVELSTTKSETDLKITLNAFAVSRQICNDLQGQYLE